MLSILSQSPPSPGRLLAFVLAASLTLGVGGCGGCGGGGRPKLNAKWGGMSEEEWLAQKKKKEEEAAKEAEVERKEAEVAKKRTEAEERVKAEQRASELAQRQAERAEKRANVARQNLPELPKLPTDAAEWKDDDFFVARVSNNPALIPAVQHVAEHRVGDAAAAPLLTRLLRPDSFAELREKYFGPNPRMRPVSKAQHGALIEAIVRALAANGTDASRACLRQLLDGTLPTDDDKAAALAAVQALVDHPCAENEDMLFELLTSGPQAAPPDKNKLSVGQLRAQAITLLIPTASIAMRLRVARHLAAGGVAPPWRELLEDLVRSENPANLEAQIVLYQDGLARQDSRIDTLETAFTGYSSQGLGLLLGLPEHVVAPADAQSHLVHHVSMWLWGKRFLALMEIRLAGLNTFSGGEEGVLLAATVPSDAMRATLFQFFQKLWHEDLHPFAAATAKNEIIFDPGLLVVLKLVARERRAQAATHTTSSRGADPKVLKEREAIQRRWEAAIDTLLQLQCRRFEAAALEQAVHAGGNRSAPPEDELPTALPPGTRLLAHYRFDASGDRDYSAAAPVATIDPIRVQYVKLDGQVQQTALVGFFRRQLGHCEEHDVDQGVWLDCIRQGASPDRQQSIDVRIVSLTPERLTLPNERQRMVVEVLSVEIRDPHEPAAVAVK